VTVTEPRLAGSPHIVDTFNTELACTIRDCLGCGCLVPVVMPRRKRCEVEAEL